MPASAQSPERRRLAELIEERRAELRLTLDQVATIARVHTETVMRVRDGSRPIRRTTRRGIEDALRWESGSIQRVLDGKDPSPLSAERPAAPDTARGPLNPDDPDVRRVLAALGLDPDDDLVQRTLKLRYIPKRAKLELLVRLLEEEEERDASEGRGAG